MAPGARIDTAVADQVKAIAAALYPDRTPDLRFHAQCHLSSGHFAGDDAARTAAFLEIANDPSVDALWFAKGGYGSCRLGEGWVSQLTEAAKDKTYLGYSDTGYLLARLYKEGFGRLVHGPMPSDVRRAGGQAAIERALRYLVERSPDTLEASVSAESRTVAFNLTILSQLVGTPWQPDLAGHVLMLEEVSEEMYRIDRALFHVTSNPAIRKVAGIMLGRCSEIPPNDPDFVLGEVEVFEHWCAQSGIRYLGRADIGHDGGNKVVPFGRLPMDIPVAG